MIPIDRPTIDSDRRVVATDFDPFLPTFMATDAQGLQFAGIEAVRIIMMRRDMIRYASGNRAAILPQAHLTERLHFELQPSAAFPKA